MGEELFRLSQISQFTHLELPPQVNLKVLNQFDFFASLISNKFFEKSNLPSITATC